MSDISRLEPTSLWQHFDAINAIPRASKNEGKIIDFIKNFGEKLHLDTKVDETGNVLIIKEATKGFENKPTVVLQSHLDMVHQKNNDVVFDFDKEGIQMFIDGDWVKARGTTLGADNGIGVASIIAILSSTHLEHPKIEGLFTIDEETGMTGAKELKPGFLNGKIMLNLDTEEDDEIDIGCAGGIDVTASKKLSTINVPANYVGYQLTVKGLNGGHSGMDIHKGLGNANKIINRFLLDFSLSLSVMIHEIDGGSLRNAIPRESKSIFAIHPDDKLNLQSKFENLKTDIKREFKSVENNLTIVLEEIQTPSTALDPIDEINILKAISAAHNGVFRMSPEIVDLVEASNNVAKVEVKNNEAKILCLTRSSVESSKLDLVNALKSSFELAGFKVEATGDYPGWAPNPNSKILKVAADLYKQLNHEEARIVACHAGLECGIIGGHYPGLDMISFGPNIKGAHSPDEKVSIVSVQKYWNFLTELLKNIPSN